MKKYLAMGLCLWVFSLVPVSSHESCQQSKEALDPARKNRYERIVSDYLKHEKQRKPYQTATRSVRVAVKRARTFYRHHKERMNPEQREAFSRVTDAFRAQREATRSYRKILLSVRDELLAFRRSIDNLIHLQRDLEGANQDMIDSMKQLNEALIEAQKIKKSMDEESKKERNPSPADDAREGTNV